MIKVEHPEGDPARAVPPYAGDIEDRERSLAFMHFNTNKLGLSLDIESDEGRELLLDLLAEADVFIEDLAPAEAERLGLDYASLEDRFPQLIVAAITPFGSTGPQRDYRAEDLNLYMYGGDGFTNPGALAYDTHPDREPVKLPFAAGDAISGTSAALAIAAALFVQPMVGGQFLDLSRQEAQVSVMHRFQMRSYLTGGIYETRPTNRHAYGDCVPCLDGYIVVYAAQNHHWKMLVELMGEPQWALDPEFETQAGRAARGEEIQRGMEDWAKEIPGEQIYRAAQRLGAPIGRFLNLDDVSTSEHERARGFFVDGSHPIAGEAEYPLQLFRATEDSPQLRRPAPLLGEHNRELICGRLGRTARQLDVLRQSGVV